MANHRPPTTDLPAPPAPTPVRVKEHGRFAGYAYLLWARLRELQREPEVIFWVFIFPLLLAFGLGIAFRDKPAGASSVAIINAPGAERALQALKAAPGAAIQAEVLDRDEAFHRFRFGKSSLVIAPAPQGGFQYVYDPARPESELARAEVDNAIQSAAGRANPIPTSAVVSNQPGGRYIDYLIPGLIGMNLMNSGMWGIGFAVVEMRQRKLLKRYLATPMRRGDFLLALISSRMVLMLLEVALLLGFGTLIFHVRVLGSLFGILLLGSVGAIAFSGIGLLTACRAQKIESVGGLINLVMMPMWIFSGIFFSYERFPAVAQPFLKALPLTALNDALRSLILEGAPVTAQATRLLVLVLWGGLSFFLALRWFRWT